ncbi:MAG: hypothetical protein RJA37_1206 [Verrucomicrobiota bacterium]|jgi:hypothetical protein
MSTTATPEAPAEAPKGPVIEILPLGQNLGRVALTLTGQEAIVRFQQELNAHGQQFGRLRQLQQRAQTALTTPEKDALGKVLETEVKDFTEKDAIFGRRYFSLPVIADRQTALVNTKIRLHAVVNEEEAAKARAAKDFKEEDLVVRGERRLLRVADLLSLDAIVMFERFAKELQARRDAFVQLRSLHERAGSEEEKTKLKELLDQAAQALDKGNQEMAQSVGYSITHNYEVEVLEAKFVILLNQEEVNAVMGAVQQQAGQQAAKAAEAPKAEAAKPEKKAEKKN